MATEKRSGSENAETDNYTNELPIFKSKDAIIGAVKNNQFVILHGETGCGKTTQVPQYLFEVGLHENGVIGITQPRKIAAVSMAKRVSWEMNETLGKTVGYEIRFDKKCGASTKIKYMTDGIFLNECVLDKQLKDYKIIMIDEAHERSVMTDVLLGLLKLIAAKRADLKVIISSATISVKKFLDYFENAEVISVKSRLFDVEVKYHEFDTDYIDKTVEIVQKIHLEETNTTNKGSDILVFLTGQEEIYRCCDALKPMANIKSKPLCGTIDFESQKEVFEPVEPGETKVVVATNIAETSITIEGIKYVIDCGYVKQNRFNPNRLMEVLEEVWISKAQANQRKGRAGRTQPGVCHRLYSEDRYNLFKEECIPEIFRKNLSEVYLRLKAFELNPEEFNFVDRPKPEDLQWSQKELSDLGLLNIDGTIEKIGRQVASLPIDPVLGKVLMTSIENKCTMDVLRIVCMFSETMQKIFKRPRNNQKDVEKKHRKFHDKDGDHFSLLKVYHQWSGQKNKNMRRKWCQDRFIDHNIMESVDKSISQIVTIFEANGIKFCDEEKQNNENIKKCFVAGYFRNICVKQPRDVYHRYFDSEVFHLHFSSCLKEIRPDIILFNDPIKSTKSFANGVMSLDEAFLRTNFENQLGLIHFPEDVKKPVPF